MEKLVRDGIPQLMADAGTAPSFRVADQSEFISLLLLKLREEVQELSQDPGVDELVDVLEVLCTLRSALEIDRNDLLAARNKKAEDRGRFDKRIVLRLSGGQDLAGLADAPVWPPEA